MFPPNTLGGPVLRTDVSLNQSATVKSLLVNSPSNAQYTFTGSNGAILTATEQVEFTNQDRQSLNVHTVSSLTLTSPRIEVFDNAILALNNSIVPTNLLNVTSDGRVDVNSGSRIQTLGYLFESDAGEVRVNSGGELRVEADTKLLRGTTTINSGGQLNALPTVDLEYNGTARLQINTSYALDDVVHLKATGGGDIAGTAFIDVGNGASGQLTVTGAGSTFTAADISDWGRDAAGNATVEISNSALATLASLRVGADDGRFVGNVTSGATLRTTALFEMGGGAANRTVSLTVDGGTLQTDGLATFDNKASLSLVNGTINFNGGATFKPGSTTVWAGGSMNLGPNATLTIDGTTLTKSSSTGFRYTGDATVRLRNGGAFQTPSYFDLGAATLDLNGGFLTVGTAGGTVSDWGNGGATTATLSNNSRAVYNSGLRMSALGNGAATVTVSSGAKLEPSSLTSGGLAASSATLNVSGGRVVSTGTVSLLRGTSVTVSDSGLLEGQDVAIDSEGGTAVVTVTGSGSQLRVNNRLDVDRTGRLTMSAGGDAEVSGDMVVGTTGGVGGSVTVTGAGSTLSSARSLTVGSLGRGGLTVTSGGAVNAVTSGTGSVTVHGTLTLGGGTFETFPGNVIENSASGTIFAAAASQIRGDLSSAGTLVLGNSQVTRGVTLRAGSETVGDNATLGSLTQQAGAGLGVNLRSFSDFDDLTVTGSATLAGNLAVSLASGFEPTSGAEFVILSADSLTGGFASVDFAQAPLPIGLGWNVLYDGTSVSLRVDPLLPGDYNSDGIVDAADYTRWRDNVGASAGTLPNDPAGGVIGDAQYTQWAANYGAFIGGGATAATTSVPEPASVMLLAFFSLGRIATRSGERIQEGHSRPNGRTFF